MRLAFFAILGFFIIPPLSVGQTLGDTYPFTLSISPEYPSPYTSILLTPSSGSLDITAATMRVQVGTKQIYDGSAQPTTVTLAGAGTPVVIKVTMRSGGKDVSSTVTVTPQDVSLVAEPLSSAPALYQGKALVPVDGTVRVVAVANLRTTTGRAIDPATASYNWTVDGTLVTGVSGIGKSAINVPSPLMYRNRTVRVIVTNADKTLVGGRSITLRSSEPILRIYEQDPLLGVRFERALRGSHAITSSEFSLFAAPYSFSTNVPPVIEWFLQGTSAQKGPVVTLRPAGQGEGTASFSVVASSGDTGSATETLSLSFGSRFGTNLFGL